MEHSRISLERSAIARYEDGKYLKKRNTFTDFVAVAEHLIAHKYTNPARLCIEVRPSAALSQCLLATRSRTNGWVPEGMQQGRA